MWPVSLRWQPGALSVSSCTETQEITSQSHRNHIVTPGIGVFWKGVAHLGRESVCSRHLLNRCAPWPTHLRMRCTIVGLTSGWRHLGLPATNSWLGDCRSRPEAIESLMGQPRTETLQTMKPKLGTRSVISLFQCVHARRKASLLHVRFFLREVPWSSHSSSEKVESCSCEPDLLYRCTCRPVLSDSCKFIHSGRALCPPRVRIGSRMGAVRN